MYLSGTGLTGQYFFNDNFTGLADTRTEAVAQNWGTASPGSGIDADTFSVRWTGQVQPRFTEHYTFTALSDEGVRVWVDGQLVVDDWLSHTARYSAGSIDLVAEPALRHPRRLPRGHRQRAHGAVLVQREPGVSNDSQRPTLHEPGRTVGQLLRFQRRQPAADRSRRSISIGGTAAPAGLTADHFQATWTGRLQANYSELYNFATTSDDGVRLWIGGELVIDHWTDHAATVDTGSKWLEAGKWYDIKLEYYENTGAAHGEPAVVERAADGRGRVSSDSREQSAGDAGDAR